MAQLKYVESVDYFPKEIRKEVGLGEFAEEAPTDKNEKETRELNEELRKFGNKRE